MRPILLIAGLGSGVQHPLSSSLVSKAYETGARRAALGTYNFSGDLGKVALPAVVAFGRRRCRLAHSGRSSDYRPRGRGRIAVARRLRSAARRGPPRQASAASGLGNPRARGFQALAAIGMIDNATRTAFLTFSPFR